MPVPLHESLLFTPGKLQEVSQPRGEIQSSESSSGEHRVNSIKGLTEIKSTENTTMFGILRLGPVNGIFRASGAFTIANSVVDIGRGPLGHLLTMHPRTSVSTPPRAHHCERPRAANVKTVPSSILSGLGLGVVT